MFTYPVWCQVLFVRCLRLIYKSPDYCFGHLYSYCSLDWMVKKKQICLGNFIFERFIVALAYSTRCGDGIDVTHKMRALHTPLHDVTVGSGYKLKTQTWPTYPSLLHTQTSLWFKAGAAQVNCSPARVFRIGTGPTKSAFGLRSVDNTNKIVKEKWYEM